MVAANLLKIGQLAQRTGVPVATIKFYLREGLLPRPTLKTSRNMAWYDESFVERIRVIKRLQERYLPLRVIKQILGEQKSITPEEVETLVELGPVFSAVATAAGREPSPEGEILRRFPELSAEQLGLLGELGLLSPGAKGYGPDDVRLLEALHRSHEAGFSTDLFPVENLGHYVELLGELAEREVRLFVHGVTGRLPRARARTLVLRALDASEPVLLLIRRKLLLRALEKTLAGKKGSRS